MKLGFYSFQGYHQTTRGLFIVTPKILLGVPPNNSRIFVITPKYFRQCSDLQAQGPRHRERQVKAALRGRPASGALGSSWR